MKKLVRPLLERGNAVIILAAIGLLPISLDAFRSALGEPTPHCILIVGDFSSFDTPASQLRQGFEARKNDLRLPRTSLIIKQVDESRILAQNNPDMQKEIERLVINAMASQPIVAVIICSTSKTVDSVLRVTSALNRPSIVAVASQDELLAKSYGQGSAIRLVPTNKAEGESLAKEILQGGTVRVSILADDSVYSAQIVRALHHTLAGSSALQRTSFASLQGLPTSQEIQVAAGTADWLICIGYEDLIRQAHRALTSGRFASQPYSGRVIFSDSAIPLISELRNLDNLSVVYPTSRSLAPPDRTREFSGLDSPAAAYRQFGKDCLDLISDARSSVGWTPNIKTAFINFWADTPKRRAEGQSQIFRADGESETTVWRASTSQDHTSLRSDAPREMRLGVTPVQDFSSLQAFPP